MTIPELKREISGMRLAGWLCAGMGAICLTNAGAIDFQAGEKIVQHSGNPTQDILLGAVVATVGIVGVLASRNISGQADVYLAEQLAQERQQTPPPSPAP